MAPLIPPGMSLWQSGDTVWTLHPHQIWLPSTKKLGAPQILETYKSLLEKAPDAQSLACLLAASNRSLKCGWIPSQFLHWSTDWRWHHPGGCGLWLGTSPLPAPPLQSLWSWSYSLATHGLSCQWSEGCHTQHTALSDFIYQSLSSDHNPSHLITLWCLPFRHTLVYWARPIFCVKVQPEVITPLGCALTRKMALAW